VMMRCPFLCCTSPTRPSGLAAAASLADINDEIPIPRIPPHSSLVSVDSDDEVLIPRPTLSRPSSATCPFGCPCLAPPAGGLGRCPLGNG
jgi:hypothetical protein